MGVARPAGRLRVLLCAFFLLVSGCFLAPGLSSAQEEPAAPLTTADIEEALVRMDALGAFFTALADRETNELASERWYRLGINYRGTAAILRRSLAGGRLGITELPAGRAIALADNGRIVVDGTLDGHWWRLPEGEAAEAQLRDVLVPALIEALAQRRLPQDWPWLADHLRAAGGLVEASQDPLARPLLARYFQAKDSYLWLSMRRAGEGDTAARQELARRQQAAFGAVRGMESRMAVTLGAADAGRLQRDWSDYVAQVDGFAVTRGWVLLDPALSRTQLGAAAREAADAVDQAAAEVVASAPRSALAAARSAAEDREAPAAVPRQAEPPVVNLETLVAQTPAEAAPREAEAEATTSAAAASAGEELLPSESLITAAPAAEADSAQQQVTSLQEEVDALQEALSAQAQEAARLEAALAAEREKVEAAERERLAAEERAKTDAAEREQLAAEEREKEVAAERERQATAPAVPAVSPAPAIAPQADTVAGPPSGQDWRLLYVLAALALLSLTVLIVVTRRGRQRRRERPLAADAGPLMLTPPAPAGRDSSLPLPPSPVIEIAEESVSDAPAALAVPASPHTAAEPGGEAQEAKAPPPIPRPRLPLTPDQPMIVTGVVPPTVEARAAMDAARVRRKAAQAVAKPEGAQGAADGDEARTAAHPIVQALRNGNLPLFEMLFGELTDLHSPQLQRIVYGGRGEDLAIVCRAVGISKLLFGSIFLLTDHLRGGGPEEEAERATAMLSMYDRMPPETARKVLAKWQRNWSGRPKGSPRYVH